MHDLTECSPGYHILVRLYRVSEGGHGLQPYISPCLWSVVNRSSPDQASTSSACCIVLLSNHQGQAAPLEAPSSASARFQQVDWLVACGKGAVHLHRTNFVSSIFINFLENLAPFPNFVFCPRNFIF